MRALSLLLTFLLLASTALAQNSGVPLPPPGQTPATQTNDNACATCVGAIVTAGSLTNGATVTISIANPAVVSDSFAGITNGQVINFTTTGALPTGLAVNTNYYVINDIPGVSYQLSATAFGPAIATSGTQSGTQTRIPYALMLTSGAVQDVTAIQLPPGQWSCTGTLGPGSNGNTTLMNGGISTTSNSQTGLVSASRVYSNAVFASGMSAWLATANINLQVATPTIYYLQMAITFTTGTALSNGIINCLRER